MKNLKIKMKLVILALASTFGFLLTAFFVNKIIQDFHVLAESQLLVERLSSNTYELRKHEKDFLARKDLKYKDKFLKTVDDLENNKKRLLKDLKQENIATEDIETFLSYVKEYERVFLELVTIQQKIGLNPKDGLYGSLRASVHKVQDSAKKSNSNELLAIVYDLRKQEKDFMLRRDLKYVKKFESKIDKLLVSSTLMTPERVKNLETYKKDFLSLIDAEVKKGLTSNDGIMKEMRTTIHKTEKMHAKMTEDILNAIEDKFTQIKIMIFTLIVISIILVLVFSFYISNGLNKSIYAFQKGLEEFFRYLNKEVDSVKLLDDSSKDEVGTMSKVINQNIKNIELELEREKNVINQVVQVMHEFEQGDLSQRINVSTRNQGLNELLTVVNKMGDNLETNINKVLLVLESFSNLDFRVKVDSQGIKEHLEKLALGVNNLGEATTKMLQDNKRNGLILQDSSSILLENVNNLNNASNTAAASLEETAAALEEITSTVNNNSEKMYQMSNLASDVTSSVSTGENLASRTTASMDEINEKVGAINEAITVIDQIAFQTNILSLNAAVEAATAGEAGKGFAVVAAEVRNLASRSAEAAKKIKGLVEDANIKANEGKTISTEMIQGYSQLNTNITKTIELINEVSSASKEQQVGISQINDAVNSLDKQTQENASVATQTYDIATQTAKISEDIVEEADKKEFDGKDNINIDSIKTKSTKEKTVQATTVKASATKITNSIQPQTKTITANNTKDDEWESF
ncbi:chemotaxis protein [Arcobacter sp. CECT 8983]|uniref:methyl-accepting chemotaxis protein n=1 Tax=Arcobacter sp. CECT 8983 TaxID=2044508 RepID=UPI00100A7949|nr:methyl-accepting chemotaxis protein [Arcobacter sp. CECT 8983]RXJ90872.1 chemotaxis protein [Arcobacter sp. CECT 8983]